MKAFEVTYSVKPTVIFMDVEKAQHYFIDDEDPKAWSKYFWSYSDLESLVDDLGLNVFNESERWEECADGKKRFVKFVEGYGHFIPDDKSRTRWTCTSEDFGTIIVDTDSELDVDWSAIDVTKKVEERFALQSK